MKKYILLIVLILIGLGVWSFYNRVAHLTPVGNSVQPKFEEDLKLYNQSANLAPSNDKTTQEQALQICNQINTQANFDNGENIKVRCIDSVYFYQAFNAKDISYCDKISTTSAMKSNCYQSVENLKKSSN